MNKSDAVAIIRALLSSTNSSYSIYNLNRDFKKETGVDIPLFGYGNIGDFLNSIPDTVKVTGIYPIQRVSLVANDKSAHIVSLVKRQKKNRPRNNFFSKQKSHYIDKRSEEVKEPQIDLKKEAFNNLKDKGYICNFNSYISLKNSSWSNESISSIDVRVHSQIGQYIEVCPCWITCPNKFYFRLRKFKRKFHDFAKKLQGFYTTNEEIPCISCDVVQPKQSYAVFYKIFSKAMWHRAEIQEINSSSRVTVNFVDYGNSAEIPRENLKYLHRDFLLLPQQAILGFLANIKPANDQSKWSLGSIKKFYDLAFDKDLIGGVVYVNDKNNSLGMALSYTGSPEIHINDTLVKEGYAEFDINISKCEFWDISKETSVQTTVAKTNISEKIPSPVYFLTSDYFNNKRLRKMFSQEKKNNLNFTEKT